MTLPPPAQTVAFSTPLPPAYTAEALVRMPGFCQGLAASARDLLDTHLSLPREVHYVADLQRWMLSQITIALHFEHQHDPHAPPLSPGSLTRRVGDSGIACRNTIHTFLMEMRRYRFVLPIESPDRRQRAVRASAMSEALIRRYFDIHLRALDLIDGGTRLARSQGTPMLLARAQPNFARLLLASPGWYRPPASIAKFVRSDSGSSVLHDLILSAPAGSETGEAPIWIGPVSPKVLSSRYQVSRTHAARLFGLAREAGLIGWARASNRGDCWIAPQLVRAYFGWQALKLASVAQAFAQACGQEQPAETPKAA